MPFHGFQDRSNPPTEHGEINFVSEAFHLQYNWIALVGAGLFAVMSGSLLPIILAGGLELMYLAMVPQNARFQRLVRSWRFSEELEQRQQQFAELLNGLPSEAKKMYAQLAQVCASVRGNFRQLSSASQIFLQQMDARLDGLLRGYARLLVTSSQQLQYLKSTDPNEIKREVAALEQAMTSDLPKVQEINKKRIEILNKRLEKYQKLSENQEVVTAQCAAVEDVLHLVRDQSVTMRDPQQVSDQLENLVRDVEQTEQTVQQVEAIFGNMSTDFEGLMSMEGPPSSSGRRRVRPTN
jgi:DNA repair exonuclease SbcCD ATPase subunit